MKKRQLEEELSEIKETSELKDELLSHLILELRSLVSVFRGSLTDLLEPAGQDFSDEESSAGSMRKKLHRLGQIIEQLEDVSHLQASRSDLEVAEIEVCSRLRRYSAFFESKANQKGIILETDLPEDEIVQTLDPGKFEKTIFILISNAIKFTPENGKVQIKLTDLDNHIEISVKDSGPGMSDEKLNNLFYGQSPDQVGSKNNDKNGGVRLSIAKKYVELHEGTLSVDSERGEGTTFTLVFPKQAKSLQKAQTKNVDPGSDILQQQHYEHERPLQYSKNNAEETILIVEDNREMQDYMMNLLDIDGLHVDVASNGAEALKQLSLTETDLIISDIIMPEMDGFEFVRKIRSDSKYHFTPIILISAKAEEEARIEGYQIGISDYLVKPFSEEELKARIYNLLRQKRERSKYISQADQNNETGFKESLVKNLKQYVESRIQNETITIKELSQSVNMSRRQLYRDLKALTGFTPAEFVREVKLRRARYLLEQDPKITVSEVARQVGYSTVAHFSKIFKKRFGRNPSEY